MQFPQMASRLVDVVTTKLLSLSEAFSRIEPSQFAALLQPSVEAAITRDAPHGAWWAWALRPFLPWALRRVVVQLQADVEECLDLREVWYRSEWCWVCSSGGDICGCGARGA